MNMLFRTCALTGHRVLPPDFDENELYDALERLISEGCDCFLCGMAQGFDLTALSCLTALKAKYRFTIEACIPYAGHEGHLGGAAREKYDALLSWCDRKTVLFNGYANGCYLARDRYMVDCADVVLAYQTKDTGGTAYTTKYAKEKGKEVRYLGRGKGADASPEKP